MATQYFYLLLRPTKTVLPCIISHSFEISYDDSTDLSQKQKAREIEFRKFNNNPQFYNSDWSKGFFDLESTNNDRQSTINNLENSGSSVSKPDWP